jgi:hypothetical protein
LTRASISSNSTDDEIEADVLAERADSTAWDALPFVRASSSSRPTWMIRARHLEIAAKIHVLYMLHYLGLEANLALSHPFGADIAVLREDGSAMTIVVKTLSGQRQWWPDDFALRKRHFVVFVDFGEEVRQLEALPPVYIIASERLRTWLIQENVESVSLERLGEALNARDAWTELLSEPAWTQ